VIGGSADYISRMKQTWNNVQIKTGVDLQGITRNEKNVDIFYKEGHAERFDHVIIATHADQALDLLNEPTDSETELLGAWNYTGSRTLLHSDASVMPPLRSVWSSWNFSRIKENQTSLTYHMNRLQVLKTKKQYFVSLNLQSDPADIIAEFNYKHPMFTRDALLSREKLKQLNGRNRTWFAGSYMGDGFHEDAVRSSVEVASGFGMDL
jgi:predicted NAD/FAD-binding protein